MKFIINRVKWGRGKGSIDSRLLNSDTDKKCCVGFYANALGFTDEEIKGRSLLEDLTVNSAPTATLKKKHLIPNWCLTDTENSFTDIRQLYTWNDDGIIKNEQEREKKIKELFARHDVEVEFVG